MKPKLFEALFCAKMAVNEGTEKGNQEKSADLSFVFRALMDLLQNSDASLKQECKGAEYKPSFVDLRIAFILKRKINEEDQHENHKELVNAETLTEENPRQGGNDHRRCRD